MSPSPPSVSLSALAARVATASYAELRALLDALPACDDAARKAGLLRLSLSHRHRLARLLAALRWARAHADVSRHAAAVEDAALTNAAALEDVTDALWDARQAAAVNQSSRPAVAAAVDIFAAGALARSPKALSSGRKDPPAEQQPEQTAERKPLLATEVSEVTQELPPSPGTRKKNKAATCVGAVSPNVTERLAIATRNCIRDSLLHTGALEVLQWRSGIADVCVKVGIRNLWHADVSLDSLDPDNARLRVHAINLHIANDVDSARGQNIPHMPGEHAKEATPQPPAMQEAVLRRVADDRMSAALQAARAIAKGNASFNPTCTMLCALRDMMIDDVCAPLAMDYLRTQAKSLAEGAWAGVLNVEGADADTPRSVPLTIHYWLDHKQPAQIRISEFRAVVHSPKMDASPIRSEENETLESSVDATLERRPGCVNCTHEPSLPSAVELGGTCGLFELKMHELNLEDLLLAAIKLRSRARLKNMSESFLKKRTALRIHPSCIVLSQPRKAYTAGDRHKAALIEDVLQIQLDNNGAAGVELRIFTMTGGMRIRPYGAAALSLPVQRFRDSSLWTGTKHLGSAPEELEAALAAFEAVRARVKLNASARSVCALDIGVSNTLPPGTASVAATASPDRAASQLVPPFAPLERRAPRRFLTLSPPPPQKNILNSLQNGSALHAHSRTRTSGSRGVDRSGSSKRPRLTYATTSDALVFIQESSFAGEDWQVGARTPTRNIIPSPKASLTETESVDRYSGTAAAAAAWAVTRDVVERRLRRDSLLRAFVAANVASAAQAHHTKASEDGDLHLESASRVLLKVKCEPLPVQRAELLLRGYDAWQVRLSLLPRIFDSTDPLSDADCKDSEGGGHSKGDGNLWSVGVACTGSQLTFTYPSANAASVRSFFRDLTRARTAAALARGVPPSPFYRVLRRSPVRIVVGIGPYGPSMSQMNTATNSENAQLPKPQYTATVEYVYSKGNSGGFSLSFSPSKPTMEQLAPLIEEALDASGGQVGGILAGLLERACPVAAAAESAVRERVNGRVRFVTALRVRAVFTGLPKSKLKDSLSAQQMQNQNKNPIQFLHAVDVDARGGSGLVTVIDVGRATAVMIQQGFAHRSGSSGGGTHRRNDFAPLPKWDEVVATLTTDGYAEAQRAGSTVVLKMEVLEQFLSDLVTKAGLARAAENAD